MNKPRANEEDFDGLTWENGMLISPDEHFVRESAGRACLSEIYVEFNEHDAGSSQ
ncbi:MAG: hypothetical protein ACLU99_10365 [Alphaproteobacteria bacterium]